MSKAKSYYQCGNCGYETSGWLGKCPSCGEWNTLAEVIEQPAAANPKHSAAQRVRPNSSAKPLREISAADKTRVFTGISELDSVLGGGVVRGSVVLAGGEPGIGKSTLFLQAADRLLTHGKVLYVSAEESAHQVKLRAKRLGIGDDLLFLSETELTAILGAIEAETPDYVVIDSVQTIYYSEIASAAGSVSQVRQCAQELARLAKATGMTVFLIGHVTKEGALAGPRVLEHLVDTVLYFEGERQSSFRILRAVKNRFGSTNEIGVFEMGEDGMRGVENPSAILLSQREKPVPGAAIFCALEGTRPMLLEVEALVCETPFGVPRRMATGVDYNRMNLILAVLEKKIGFKLYNQDVYVNVGGGMRLMEPALDLAIAASVVSSFRNRPVLPGSAFFGEVGLTGEVRHSSQAEKRVLEAARMGLSRVVLPKANARELKNAGGIELIGVSSVSQMLETLF